MASNYARGAVMDDDLEIEEIPMIDEVQDFKPQPVRAVKEEPVKPVAVVEKAAQPAKSLFQYGGDSDEYEDDIQELNDEEAEEEEEQNDPVVKDVFEDIDWEDYNSAGENVDGFIDRFIDHQVEEMIREFENGGAADSKKKSFY